MRLILPCVAMMLFVHGCMSPFATGNAAISDPELVAQVQEGMTKSEVEDILGKPITVDFTGGGLEKWGYSYAKVSGVFSVKTETHTLTVLFDEKGVVKRVGKGEQAGR